MAVRKKLTHDMKTRERIQTSQLVNRLINHALGKNEMTQTQVRAAEILLKKALPDLQSVEMNHGTQDGDPIQDFIKAVTGQALKPKDKP